MIMQNNYYSDRRKVAIIGCGLVGMSCAYALELQGACDELVLIDINKTKAWGEAADLSHGISFAPRNMKIYAGEYKDTHDADIVVIAAGVNQAKGEDRIALLQRNADVFNNVVLSIQNSGFSGIYIVATNPVDIMTRLTQCLSGAAKNRVIGSGTMLDTARLRYLLGNYFTVDPKNIHAYVMGEHGESEFVPWSQAMVATKSALDICEKDKRFSVNDLYEIGNEVRNSAANIIVAKGATCYGIGASLVRLINAIFSNEHSIFTLSVNLNGEYGKKDIYVGAPAIVSRDGIREIIELSLNEDEYNLFAKSCDFLNRTFEEMAPRFV